MSPIMLWFVVWLIFAIIDGLAVPNGGWVKAVLAVVILIVVIIFGPDLSVPNLSFRR